MLPERLERLPLIRLEDGSHALLAADLRARLLGLALLDPLPPEVALVIPRCRSIHTFGMRFAIDVTFLDADDRPLRVERAVAPGRVLGCRGARAVLERPASP
jgi:uncharacterized protein